MTPLLPPKVRTKPTRFILALLIAGIINIQTTHAASNSSLPPSLQEIRFIAYTPRSFSVNEGKVTPASRSGIEKDLEILRPHFNGLITYSASNGVEEVAEIAREHNFRAIIMGIWDPSSDIEINNAVPVFRKYPDLVNAVIVGNEGIYTKRYTPGDVQHAIMRIKSMAPKLAVTTSEPFFLYFTPEYSNFFGSHELLMPNIHPVFEEWFRPTEVEPGVTMVLNVTEKLQGAYHLPIIIKETGLPSGDSTQGHSATTQARFWRELNKRFQSSPTLAFAYFEAFDAPWKPALMATQLPGNHKIEAYWGLFTATGQAKEIISRLPQLTKNTPKKIPTHDHP